MKPVIAPVEKPCEVLIGKGFTAIAWCGIRRGYCPCGCKMQVIIPVIQAYRVSHN